MSSEISPYLLESISPKLSLSSDSESKVPPLRPYQLEIARTILGSVAFGKGLTFSVEIARQGGKNELSAQIEIFLLAGNMSESKNIIKCSPTFRP